MALEILSIGYAHPTNIVDNKFIESLHTDTSDSWIMEKIGIRTRVSSLPLDYIRQTRNANPREALKNATCSPTDLAVEASKQALSKAGVSPNQVGLIICDCCNPETQSPTEAQRIAQRLNTNAQAYEVLTACPAFALHLDYLMHFREECLPEYILCITTAAITQKVNYGDRTDGAIWSDGAAAWLVSAKHKGKLRVIETSFAADPTRCEAVVIETFGFFHQDGRAIRDFSVRQTVRLIKALETKHGLDWSKDVFVGHQANRTMLRQICDNREIPDTNHWYNADAYGNQAGAGAPIVIAMNWDRIQTGQKILVAVVGAGLSWGSALLEAV